MTQIEKIIEYCEQKQNVDLNSHRGAYENVINYCKQLSDTQKDNTPEDYVMD